MSISREQELENLLSNNGVWRASVTDYFGDGKCTALVVEIRGDWKHDHLRARWLLAEQGYSFMGEEVTEEDGSDYYSAIHRYVKVGGE